MIEARCDIIIPVRNRQELTNNCLASIKENSDIPYSVILIDNASDGAARAFLEDFRSVNRNVSLIRNEENLGWVKAVNQGMKLSKGEYLCVMNNDTVVSTSGWLSKLIAVAESEEDIGLVNPYFDMKGCGLSDKLFTETDFCRGYCILIKRKVVERIGLLDESYGMGYYDDDDYSVRAIRAGFRCVRANGVFVEHLRDSTFVNVFRPEEISALHEKNKKLFYSRWGKRLKVVFIITKDADRSAVSDIALAIARRQHDVYVWNSGAPLGIEHTSIIETPAVGFFSSAVFWLRIFLNGWKSPPKRYDAVFGDTRAPGLAPLPSRSRQFLRIEPGKDARRIVEIVDSLSRQP